MLMIRKTRAKLLVVLSASMLLLAQTDVSRVAAEVKPGVKRCALLQSQLTAAVKSKHMVLSSRAKSLEAEAQQFCSQGKTAQGNRAYVKVLNSLGIMPDLGTEHVATGEVQ
ncbi:hypothetical protein [Aestuariivirga sp.]|uniref:hypothetical protein n=1 Tax=Aestuariivirga sp. TaxID=2650926 RepID=UPI0030171826